VPRFPGAFSAWGMLETDLRRDFSRSFYAKAAAADLAALTEIFRLLEAEGRAALADEGVPADATRVEHSLDMRYEAQEYTLTIAAGDPLADGFVEQIAQRFHEAHDARYGHSNPGAPVEFVTARTVLLGELGRAAPEQIEPSESAHPRARETVFGRRNWDTVVVSRHELAEELSGPAIVDEQTATTVVPPGWTLHVGGLGTLLLSNVGEDA
jgi:N-methylhydantoinase A